MEEKREPSISSANGRPILCEECKVKPSKYKCPGCSLRSCSLLCVNAHKQRTACTGKKPVANSAPLSKFDDNLILSDYNMLEDVKRIAESAQRIRVKLCGNYQFRIPFPLKNLRNAAASRRTRILFHSNGMSKRETNKTYYNNRKKFISWTIEWRFHLTDVVIVDHGHIVLYFTYKFFHCRIHENTSLSSVIENHLKPGPWNHKLKQFCDETLDSLRFFIRKYPKGPKSPFCQLNMKAPIREQLANMVILEYPVILVFLPSHSYDFEVIKNSIPIKKEIKESSHNDQPSPKGVTFKVEEIEDRGASEPHVSDLKQCAYENSTTEKEAEYSAKSPLAVRAVKGARSIFQSDTCTRATEDNAGCSFRTMQLAPCDDIDFDLEPGLLDVYSNLMSETNIDNLLDFGTVLADQHKNMDVETFLLEEELEEGEIA
ncbi:box C/D snoRNA protein 1 [Dorcoceras hygrometricum]|uniref:Box C/D snoRNA protein 1 n=1 Tax=Dorcoceras hygrometricum TaxID=472368 RepID=A0A2Z7AFC3_9LAMI|nr:box C/D snoRNA protein 1 [Dorcoceras hygrometricum]